MTLSNKRMDIFFAFSLPLVAFSLSLLIGISLVDKATGWFGISPQSILLDNYAWMKVIVPFNVLVALVFFFLGLSNRLGFRDLLKPRFVLGFTLLTITVMFLAPSMLIDTMTMTGFNFKHIRGSSLIITVVLWVSYIETKKRYGNSEKTSSLAAIMLCILLSFFPLFIKKINGLAGTGLEVPLLVIALAIYHYYRPLSYTKLQILVVTFGSYIVLVSSGMKEAALLLTVIIVGSSLLRKIKGWHLLAIFVAIVLLILLFFLASPYRLLRFLSFLDPWADPFGAGYSHIWRLLAEANGGFMGVGWGNSISPGFEGRMGFEGVLSLVVEEFGIFPLVFLSVACMWFIIRGFKILTNENDASHVILVLAATFFSIHSIVFGLAFSQSHVAGVNFPLISFSPFFTFFYALMFGVLARKSLYLKPKQSLDKKTLFPSAKRWLVNPVLMFVALGSTILMVGNALDRRILLEQLDARTLRIKVENNGVSADTLDRNEEKISESIQAYTAVVNPSRALSVNPYYSYDPNYKPFIDYVSSAKKGFDFETLRDIVLSRRGASFRYVKRGIEQAPTTEASSLERHGIYIIREWKRKLHVPSMKHLVGVANVDHEYLYGLDKVHQEQMEAYKTTYRLRRVSAYEDRLIETFEGTAGEKLKLNIDINMQRRLGGLLKYEDANSSKISDYYASGNRDNFPLEAARAIVIDPGNGEVVSFIRVHNVSSDLPAMTPSRIPKIERILGGVGFSSAEQLFCGFEVSPDNYRLGQSPASSCQNDFSNYEGDVSAKDFKNKMNDWQLLALLESAFSNGQFTRPSIVSHTNFEKQQLIDQNLAAKIREKFEVTDSSHIPYTLLKKGLSAEEIHFSRFDDHHPDGHILFGDANSSFVVFSLYGRKIAILLTYPTEYHLDDSFYRELSSTVYEYMTK